MLTAQTAGLQFLHQYLTGGVHTANENFFNKTPDCSFNHSFLGSEKVSCKTSKDSERKILQRYFDFGPTTSKAAAAGSVWGAEPEPSAAGSCTWSCKKNKIPKYPTCNYDWSVWRERVSPSAALDSESIDLKKCVSSSFVSKSFCSFNWFLRDN